MADVSVSNGKLLPEYLRTSPDNSIPDNLSELPECNYFGRLVVILKAPPLVFALPIKELERFL